MYATRERLSAALQPCAHRNATQEVREVGRVTFERPVFQLGERLTFSLPHVEHGDAAEPHHTERGTALTLRTFPLSDLDAARGEDSDALLAFADLTPELLPRLVTRHAGRVGPLRNNQTDVAEAVVREGRSCSEPRSERVRIRQLLDGRGQAFPRLANLFSCAHGDDTSL